MREITSFPRSAAPAADVGGHYDPQICVRGDGEPLVLVPGMDGSGRLFYRQVPSLARTHRVATYALREGASMNVLVDDLSRVIDAIAPAERRATVVGESFGGALAISFALARPERVSALVVVNSFPCFVPQLRLRLAIVGLRLMPWGAMRLVRRLTAFRLHSRHTHRMDVERFLALTADLRREGYLGRLEALRRYDVRTRLAEIQVPTLLLAAEKDHLVPAVREARFMARRVPHATLATLSGHGHICLIAPDLDLAAILRDWRSGALHPLPD